MQKMGVLVPIWNYQDTFYKKIAEMTDLTAIGVCIHGVCDRALGGGIHHAEKGLTGGGHLGRQITVICHA